jgi:DNA polymerase I
MKTMSTTLCVSLTKAHSTRATDASVDDFTLSRWSDVDYQQLINWSTYLSYGHVGHLPARYKISIQATIDGSNALF